MDRRVIMSKIAEITYMEVDDQEAIDIFKKDLSGAYLDVLEADPSYMELFNERESKIGDLRMKLLSAIPGADARRSSFILSNYKNKPVLYWW